MHISKKKWVLIKKLEKIKQKEDPIDILWKLKKICYEFDVWKDIKLMSKSNNFIKSSVKKSKKIRKTIT